MNTFIPARHVVIKLVLANVVVVFSPHTLVYLVPPNVVRLTDYIQRWGGGVFQKLVPNLSIDSTPYDLS